MFLQSIEYAAADAYEQVVATGKLADDVLHVVAAFGEHHRQHGESFGGLTGGTGRGESNQSFAGELKDDIERAADQTALLRVLFDLENRLAATATASLGEIVGLDGSATMASIQPIEGRHAVVLGQTLELDPGEYLVVFQSDEDALTVNQYPLSER